MSNLRKWLAMAMVTLMAFIGAAPLPAAADVAPLAVSRGGTGATSLDGAGILTKAGDQVAAGNKTFTGHTTLGLVDVTGALTGTPASMRASEAPQIEAMDDEPLDSVMSETTRMA